MIDSMRPAPWHVTRRRRETRDTVSLELTPADARGYVFAPGQFNMLYVFGVGEVPISLSGDPAAPRLTHTVRRVGAVSAAIARMKRGAVLGVRGPFGTSWPVQQAAGGDLVIVAGGIGLAPLRPAIYWIGAHRAQFRRVSLLYGGRTPADLLYVKEFAGWRRRFDVDVQVTVDSAGGDWQGHVGVVTPLIGRAAFSAPDTTALVCGPEIMMRFAARELRQRGVAEAKISLSMERNMKCALGWCGHCQWGPAFVCKEGPVFSYARIAPWLGVREM